jgi:hypothetical protein
VAVGQRRQRDQRAVRVADHQQRPIGGQRHRRGPRRLEIVPVLAEAADVAALAGRAAVAAQIERQHRAASGVQHVRDLAVAAAVLGVAVDHQRHRARVGGDEGLGVQRACRRRRCSGTRAGRVPSGRGRSSRGSYHGGAGIGRRLTASGPLGKLPAGRSPDPGNHGASNLGNDRSRGAGRRVSRCGGRSQEEPDPARAGARLPHSSNQLEAAEAEANKAIAYLSTNEEAYNVRGLVHHLRALADPEGSWRSPAA